MIKEKKKVGAPKKYRTPLMGVFSRVANETDKAKIKKLEKQLLQKHKI